MGFWDILLNENIYISALSSLKNLGRYEGSATALMGGRYRQKQNPISMHGLALQRPKASVVALVTDSQHHIFPSCDFPEPNLTETSPNLHQTQNQAH